MWEVKVPPSSACVNNASESVAARRGRKKRDEEEIGERVRGKEGAFFHPAALPRAEEERGKERMLMQCSARVQAS